MIQGAREILKADELSNREFRHHPIYSRIKPYLSENAVKAVEGKPSNDGPFATKTIRVVMGDGRNSGVNPFKNRVLDDLVALEKKWELI